MENLQKLFRTLDLTAFEAKVYVALLSHGPLSPSRLAEILGVHRPQVHASLRRLILRGLVEVHEGKPAMYRAVEPETLFEIISEEFDDMMDKSKSFINTIPRKKEGEEYGVWIFKSRRGLIGRYVKAVSRAKVDLAISGDIVFISKLRKYVIAAQRRGVTVYVIVYDIPGVKFKEKVFEGFHKVKRAVSGDLLVVADSQIGILAQRRNEIETLPSYGIAVEEPMLIDYLLQDFFYRWLRSRTIIDEDIKLPVKYTMFKLGLIEVRKLIERGCRLWGIFRGRWLRKPGEDGNLEGEIIKAFFDPETGIAQIHVRSDDGNIYTAGGADAIVEDFATSEMLIKEV